MLPSWLAFSFWLVLGELVTFLGERTENMAKKGAPPSSRSSRKQTREVAKCTPKTLKTNPQPPKSKPKRLKTAVESKVVFGPAFVGKQQDNFKHHFFEFEVGPKNCKHDAKTEPHLTKLKTM